MVLKVFGLDFFLILLGKVMGYSSTGTRGIRRNMEEFTRSVFLLCEKFIFMYPIPFLSPFLNVIAQLVNNEDVPSFVMQCALRFLYQVPWREEMTGEFVEKFLNRVLDAASHRPLLPFPLVGSRDDRIGDKKGKLNRGEKSNVDPISRYCGYIHLPCHIMASNVLSSVFGCIKERKQSLQYKRLIFHACDSYINFCLRGDDVEKNIRGLAVIVAVSMALSEIGNEIVVKQIGTILGRLTNFPSSSVLAKHTMILLASEIVAIASSQKEFRMGHIQLENLKDVYELMRDSSYPDVQARALAILAKLGKDNSVAQNILKTKGNISSLFL